MELYTTIGVLSTGKYSNNYGDTFDKEAFKERLESLVERYHNGNSTAFANKAGMNDRTFKKYLNGSMPGADKLLKIAIAGRVSVDWLLTGKDFVEPELDDRTHQAVEFTKTIMASGDAVIVPALEANLVAFVGAIKTNERSKEIEKDNKELRKDVDKLEKEVKRLGVKRQLSPPVAAPGVLDANKDATNNNV